TAVHSPQPFGGSWCALMECAGKRSATALLVGRTGSTKNQRQGLLPTRRGKAVSPLTLRHRSPQSTASRRFLVRPYGVRRKAQGDGAFSWPDGLN
ncbi:MAG TPA: hypothetical protein DCE44_12430, partial [Verrucomicrobiales bacterium]|nr:hypothetical protein [Verrucomicrobiales bacterium]